MFRLRLTSAIQPLAFVQLHSSVDEHNMKHKWERSIESCLCSTRCCVGFHTCQKSHQHCATVDKTTTEASVRMQQPGAVSQFTGRTHMQSSLLSIQQRIGGSSLFMHIMCNAFCVDQHDLPCQIVGPRSVLTCKVVGNCLESQSLRICSTAQWHECSDFVAAHDRAPFWQVTMHFEATLWCV